MAATDQKYPLGDTESDEKVVAVPPFVDSGEDFEASYGVNEKALLRKLDFKLLPAVTLLYLLSFLDRSNGNWREVPAIVALVNKTVVANARIEGLTTDLHMSMHPKSRLKLAS